MRRYILIPILGAIALFQASGLPPFAIKPDLMLLATISWGSVVGARQGLLCAILGGALLDLFTAAPFGISILAFTPIVLVVYLGEIGVIESKSAMVVIGAFFGTILYYTVFLLVFQILGRRVDWYDTTVWTTLPAAAINTFLALPVLWVAEKLARWALTAR